MKLDKHSRLDLELSLVLVRQHVSNLTIEGSPSKSVERKRICLRPTVVQAHEIFEGTRGFLSNTLRGHGVPCCPCRNCGGIAGSMRADPVQVWGRSGYQQLHRRDAEPYTADRQAGGLGSMFRLCAVS